MLEVLSWFRALSPFHCPFIASSWKVFHPNCSQWEPISVQFNKVAIVYLPLILKHLRRRKLDKKKCLVMKNVIHVAKCLLVHRLLRQRIEHTSCHTRYRAPYVYNSGVVSWNLSVLINPWYGWLTSNKFQLGESNNFTIMLERSQDFVLITFNLSSLQLLKRFDGFEDSK